MAYRDLYPWDNRNRARQPIMPPKVCERLDVLIAHTNGVYHKPCWWPNGDGTYTASVQLVENSSKYLNKMCSSRNPAREWAIRMCTQQPIPKMSSDDGQAGFLPDDEEENSSFQSSAGFLPDDEAVVPVPQNTPSHDCNGDCRDQGKDCSCDSKPVPSKPPKHPNDGKTHCIKCNMPTKAVPLLMGNLDVCANSGCSLYDV